MNIVDQIFVLLQRIIPQHWLSLQMHKLMRCEVVPIKNFLIKNFINLYNVDMSIAIEKNPQNFIHFNEFFVRELETTARPFLTDSNSIASPVDGAVSQAGLIEKYQLFQAKGKTFSLSSLLANDQQLTENFINGYFSTLYLSPKDYHRIHMPLDGKLKKMIYVPGDLFAVNQRTVEHVPELFARNERTIILFETDSGPFVLIMVGAIFVGSMETVWHEEMITPPYKKEIKVWNYDSDLTLKKGEEMGRFNMGSTVVLLFGKDQISWAENQRAGTPIKMGQQIGEIR